MKLLVAGLLPLLASCVATVPEARTVRVEVPVQVPCRMPVVTVPVFATAGLVKTDALEAKVRALLAERRQRIAYEKELSAAQAACE